MSALFFIIAALYSIVGFGGGSSYTAVLVLFGIPYQNIPIISLMCNLVVVCGGTYFFVKHEHFSWKLSKFFLITSVPMAFVGGLIPVSKHVFVVTLGTCLILVGFQLLWDGRKNTPNRVERIPFSNGLAALIGSVLGFLAGLVGIGGGIFLSPIMLALGWGKPKEVASTASTFILLNSIAGLIGQTVKHQATENVLTYWPLFLAVFLGGQIGSRLGAKWLSQLWVLRLTSLLILYVGIYLFKK